MGDWYDAAHTPASPAAAKAVPTPAPEFAYAIRAQHGSFIQLDGARTFRFGRAIENASLFPTATLAEEAVKYRNSKMTNEGFSLARREPFIIVPVKITTTKTPVTTYKTKVTRELA